MSTEEEGRPPADLLVGLSHIKKRSKDLLVIEMLGK
jgi:hypothetical protein